MTAKPPEHRLLRSLPLLALALAVATTACDVAGGAEAELATGPASVRVSVAAELRAGKTSRVTDPPPAPPPPLAPPPSAPPPPAPMEARASSGPPAPPAPSDPPPPPGAGPERTP